MRSQSVHAACIATLFMGACSAGAPVITTRVKIQAQAIDRAKLDLTDLGLALTRTIEGERIRPRPLFESKSLLAEYLGQAGHVGPTTTPDAFPTDDAKLAYVLNCHTAAVLHSLASLCTESSMPADAPIGFEIRNAYLIDGQWRTPAALRSWASAMAGDDWRVVLALPTITSDGPAVSERLYLPELLDAQLDHRVRSVLASPRVVRVDHGEIKQILFWNGLWGLRQRLIADYESRFDTTDARMLNVLLDWSKTGFRRVTLNSAVGYAENPMPSDRRIPWAE